MTSEAVLWVIVVLMLVFGGTPRIYKKSLRIIVSMLLKLARDQYLGRADIEQLQELEKELGPKR